MKVVLPVLNRKEIIIHSFLIVLFISSLLLMNKHFPYYYLSSIRFKTYILIGLVCFFYIHILVLLPVLFKENNRKKYILFLTLCFFIFSVVESYFGWLYIHSHSQELKAIFEITMVPVTIQQTIRVFMVLAFFMAIVTVISFIYAFFIFEKQRVTLYLELFLNTLFIFIVGVLIMNYSKILNEKVILIPIILIIFYLYVFFISPILLVEKKPVRFVLWLTILCTGFYLLIMFSIDYPKFHSKAKETFLEYEYILNIIPSYAMVLFMTIIVSFVYSYLRIKIQRKEQFFSLKLGAKESELRLLKSQVNPHFLFNTLNTLYATALEEKASKTAESASKLASLLRYMQDDINKDYIPLKNEIRYLKDYISIQESRCAIKPKINITFKNIRNQIISPGLLIPFIENAFKYGIDPSNESCLTISIICNKKSIHFSCVNTYNEKLRIHKTEEGFGIGIKNTKQRLDLVYPENHIFEILKENNTFSVNLIIPIRNA